MTADPSFAEIARGVHEERQADRAERMLTAAEARVDRARDPEAREIAEADARRAQAEVVRHRLGVLLPRSAGSTYATERLVRWLRSEPVTAAMVARLAEALLVDPKGPR